MKHAFLRFALALLVAGSGLAGEQSESSPTETSVAGSSLWGEWLSFEIGGGEMTNSIKSIGYTFSPDGSITAFATMADGQEMKAKGSYVRYETELEMTSEETGTAKMAYSIEGDVLTIRDAKAGVYVKLRKRTEAMP